LIGVPVACAAVVAVLPPDVEGLALVGGDDDLLLPQPAATSAAIARTVARFLPDLRILPLPDGLLELSSGDDHRP
jgi:hypothetical protein